MTNGNGLAGLLRAKAGTLAAIFFFMIGATVALWAAGILALPGVHDRDTEAINKRLDNHDAGITVLRDSLGAVADSVVSVNQALLYTICTQIPPATRNELRALRRDCGNVEREIQREISGGGGN